MNEQWLPIKGYEGFYEASNLGRIRRSSAAIGTWIGRVLKNNPVPQGYHLVHLRKEGTQKSFLVHRLVAECFVSNPQGKNVVHHLDGDKGNDCASNLVWTTRQENTQRATADGLMPRGEMHGCSKLVTKQIQAIRLEYSKGQTSQYKLAKQYNVSQCQIWRIVHRKSWTHI